MLAFQDESIGLIEAFAWDFNGEGADDRKNPEFRFETSGTKTVRLTVRGPGGTNTAAQQITVEPREVSAQLVWLDTNGLSIAIPAKLEYGTANPVHVRNRELVVSVEDTFEVILPTDRPADGAVVLALDEALTNVFQLEQRVTDTFRPVAVPARLQESGRFRVALRSDAPAGEHSGFLRARAEGTDLLLNGKREPIPVGLHIAIASGGPSFPGGVLAVLALAGTALVWRLLRPRPLAYPVSLTLEETAPTPQAGGATQAFPRIPPKTFRLERAGEMVCLGADPDHKHVYDLQAPEWFIMAGDKTLELCRRSAPAGRRLQSGQILPVTDTANRNRQVKVTFGSVPKPKTDSLKTTKI
jgi:PKD repeat protein